MLLSQEELTYCDEPSPFTVLIKFAGVKLLGTTLLTVIDIEHIALLKLVAIDDSVEALEYPIVDTVDNVLGKLPILGPPTEVKEEITFIQLVPPVAFVTRTCPVERKPFVFESSAYIFLKTMALLILQK